MINEELNGHQDSNSKIQQSTEDVDAEQLNENVSTQENVVQPQLQISDSNPPIESYEQRTDENQIPPTNQEQIQSMDLNLLSEDFGTFVVPQPTLANQNNSPQQQIQSARMISDEEDEFDQEVTSQIQDENNLKKTYEIESNQMQPLGSSIENQSDNQLDLRQQVDQIVIGETQQLEDIKNQNNGDSGEEEDQFDGFQTITEEQDKKQSQESQNFQQLYLSSNPSELQTPVLNSNNVDIFQDDNFQRFQGAEQCTSKAQQIILEYNPKSTGVQINNQESCLTIEENQLDDQRGQILRQHDDDEFCEPVEVEVTSKPSTIQQDLKPQQTYILEKGFEVITESTYVQAQNQNEIHKISYDKAQRDNMQAHDSYEFSDPFIVEVKSEDIASKEVEPNHYDPFNQAEPQKQIQKQEEGSYQQTQTMDEQQYTQQDQNEDQDDFDDFVEPEVIQQKTNFVNNEEQVKANSNNNQDDDENDFGDFNEVVQDIPNQKQNQSEDDCEKLVEGDDSMDHIQEQTDKPLIQQKENDDEEEGFDDFEEAVGQQPNQDEKPQSQSQQIDSLPHEEEEVQFNLASKDQAYLSQLFMSLVTQKPNLQTQPPSDYKFQAEVYQEMFVIQRKNINTVIPTDVWTNLPAKMEFMYLLGLKDIELKHQGSSPPLKTPALETAKTTNRDVFTFDNPSLVNSVGVINNSVQDADSDMLSKVEIFLQALPDYSCMFEQIQIQ